MGYGFGGRLQCFLRNIGNSEYSSKKFWQSSNSLTEELFTIRKHQAFRALDRNVWETGGSDRSATSRRLIGRSVWNSKWKIVIPGYTLLNDPEEEKVRLNKWGEWMSVI